MKKLKKVLLVLLAVLMVAPALAACSEKKPTVDPEPVIELVSIDWLESYYVGDEFEEGTLKVKEDGNLKELKITKDMVSGFDTSKVGEFTLVVTYKNFTTEFIITVAKKEPVIEILSVNLPLEYELNEKFTEGELKITEDGVEKIVKLTEDMVSGFDTSKLGEVEITITYMNHTKNITINVVEKSQENGDSGWLPWV